jgi:hypothetical protein
MSHTPTPWQLIERSCGGFKLADADGEFISFLCSSRYPDNRPDEEAEANAAFIVTACNAHTALVKALRDLESVISQGCIPDEAIRNARAALAKVKS